MGAVGVDKTPEMIVMRVKKVCYALISLVCCYDKTGA
tara:strand:+ start:994 stop:1104 length:111 start_codon:yes stop_codon:yes gene_type:complete